MMGSERMKDEGKRYGMRKARDVRTRVTRSTPSLNRMPMNEERRETVETGKKKKKLNGHGI